MSTLGRVHVILTGLVQGVGMRYFVYLQAKQLHLQGYVRNQRDGSVEVVAEGSREDLEKLVLILEQSPLGRVTGVEKSWEPPRGEFTDFSISR